MDRWRFVGIWLGFREIYSNLGGYDWEILGYNVKTHGGIFLFGEHTDPIMRKYGEDHNSLGESLSTSQYKETTQ